MNSSRINNFDLIRLVASLQVMLYHALTFFRIDDFWQPKIKEIISYFPGVPIFFTISGFLIYRSLERNSDDLKRYFKNRLIRIFPALWVCLVFTIILLFVSEQLQLSDLATGSFWTWILAQMSFFQFYKTPLVSNWGVGHPNGSLWSISVELQYYFFLPILFVTIFKNKRQKSFQNLVIIGLAILSLIYSVNQETVILESELTGKLMGVILFKYLYFFCIGILIHLNFDVLRKYLEGKGYIWFMLFMIYMLVFRNWLGLFDNVYEISVLGVIGLVLLGLTTMALTFSKPALSSRLLKGNDISYGIYIFHMPIINYFYHRQIEINWEKLLLICVIVISVAYLSWQLIEKRMLRFKM